MNPGQGSRMLVTGGAGFLGSFVVEALRRRGYQHVLVPRSTEYNLVDQDAVKRLYREAQPDVVIHLAAKVGGIGANQRHPGGFFYENLMMGVQMLEEARRCGLQKFVTVGTVCAYPKLTPVPFKETDLWNGYPEETNAPYGLAKKMLLVQAQAYRQEYGLNAIYLLPVNLYGPRDHFDLERSHVIPALIRKCLEANEHRQGSIDVWGDGSPTREFLYVEDAAEALILAMERYEGAEPVNIGSGQEIAIRELVALIAQLTGFDGQIVWDHSKPNGQPRRRLEISGAERAFGFRARIGLREGLNRTIAWYQRQRAEGSLSVAGHAHA